MLVEVGEAALALGSAVQAYVPSGLPGPKGNLETFVWLSDRAQEGTRRAGSLEALARRAEP